MAAKLDEGVASRERDQREGNKWPGKSIDVKTAAAAGTPE